VRPRPPRIGYRTTADNSLALPLLRQRARQTLRTRLLVAWRRLYYPRTPGCPSDIVQRRHLFRARPWAGPWLSTNLTFFSNMGWGFLGSRLGDKLSSAIRQYLSSTLNEPAARELLCNHPHTSIWHPARYPFLSPLVEPSRVLHSVQRLNTTFVAGPTFDAYPERVVLVERYCAIRLSTCQLDWSTIHSTYWRCYSL